LQPVPPVLRFSLQDWASQALENRVDEALDDGRLTQEQADELKERIDTDDYPLVFGRGGHGGPGPDPRPGITHSIEGHPSFEWGTSFEGLHPSNA